MAQHGRRPTRNLGDPTDGRRRQGPPGPVAALHTIERLYQFLEGRGTGDFAKDVSLGPPFGVHLLVGGVPLALGNYIAINRCTPAHRSMACWLAPTAPPARVWCSAAAERFVRPRYVKRCPAVDAARPATIRAGYVPPFRRIRRQPDRDRRERRYTVRSVRRRRARARHSRFLLDRVAFTASMGWVKARFR